MEIRLKYNGNSLSKLREIENSILISTYFRKLPAAAGISL
jgi:hypothetical protein